MVLLWKVLYIKLLSQKIKILSMQYHTEAGVDYNQNVNNNPNSVNICNFGITSIPNPNSDSTEPKYLY